MRITTALLVLAGLSCQRSEVPIDIDVMNLTPVRVLEPYVETTPSRGTRVSPPPLAATSTVTFSPAGMVTKSEVVSVTLSVDVSGAAGGDLALELVAPDGSMYQRPEQPLGTDPFASQHFDFTFPVAGTWIDSMSLTGTWHAHLMFGSTELLHDTFELVP